MPHKTETGGCLRTIPISRPSTLKPQYFL
ncbi:hypothetical protein EMIT0158MI4_150203 [Burkholderia ambifaria]